MESSEDNPAEGVHKTGQSRDSSEVAIAGNTMEPLQETEARTAVMASTPIEWTGKCFGVLNYSMNPVVFALSVSIIWGFIIWCLVDGDAETRIGVLQTSLVHNFSWLYIGAVVGFLTLMVVLLIHPKYSQIKLGKPGVPPKYSMMTWFAMLFSASYGNDLYYYGVAQPVMHFRDSVEGWNRFAHLPPQQQAVSALNMSWFHTGFAGLAIYCVVGLSIGFLAHRHDMAVTVRTCFWPILGDRVNGVIGDVIDTAAVIATMFGLATNLGLGVMQINAGMERVFDAPYTPNSQIIIIWAITLLATISVVTGVDKGIKYLSQFNFVMGCVLILYLFFVGDTFFLLNLFVETCGQHIQTFPALYTKTDSFEQIGFDDESDPAEWMGWWTVFYWGWWIAWSPFVGTFIAQIAQGRTVRVFILGNLIVPTLVTAVWTTVMGGLGAKMEFQAMEMGLGDGCLLNANFTEPITNGTITRLSCASADHQMFLLFEHYPMAQFFSVLGLVGILGYFVTSSDSASFVIDMITSNGMVESPKIQRVFWALSEGAAATALLAAGGTQALTALQTASIAAAFPFIFLLIVMAYALIEALGMDEQLMARRRGTENGRELESMNGGSDSHHIHKPVTSTDSILNGNSCEISNGIPHDAVMPQEQHQSLGKWRLGFFEDLCGSTSKDLLKSVFCPCFRLHSIGRRIGMYAIPGQGPDLCADVLWAMAVFGTPLTIVAMDVASIWKEGMFALSMVIWVAFVVIGAVHRLKVREYYRLQGNPLVDVMSFCCCYCLAVRQESVQCETALI